MALCCCAAAGCGGSGQASTNHTAPKPTGPVAARVCQAALQAARTQLGGGTSVRIADRDPSNIECLLSGAGMQMDVVAQASPRAWEQFDTVVVHQGQAFGKGTGSAQKNQQLPVDLAPVGDAQSAWIPASRQLVATNGSQSTGGSYVTVNVTRSPKHGPSNLKVAQAVAIATLARAPRGPSPGPPPS